MSNVAWFYLFLVAINLVALVVNISTGFLFGILWSTFMFILTFLSFLATASRKEVK